MKKETPIRKARRKYEEVHYDERREANKVWGTSVPREFAEELDGFLRENKLSKAKFLYLSYELVKEHYKNKNTNN